MCGFLKPDAPKAVPQVLPRAADPRREDTGAVVKETPTSNIESTYTDVAIKKTRKNARTAVPGLGL